MLNKDYIYSVYDVVLDEEVGVRIDIYETKIEVEGKERHYVHTYKMSKYPENLSNEIAMLKGWNYLGMNAFNPNVWDVSSKNPLIAVKMLLLARQNKLLEKAYDAHTIIGGMLYITKYIYYVNMETGKEVVMSVGVEKFSKENIEILESEGYKPIENSTLISHAILYPEETTQVSKR